MPLQLLLADAVIKGFPANDGLWASSPQQGWDADAMETAQQQFWQQEASQGSSMGLLFSSRHDGWLLPLFPRQQIGRRCRSSSAYAEAVSCLPFVSPPETLLGSHFFRLSLLLSISHSHLILSCSSYMLFLFPLQH